LSRATSRKFGKLWLPVPRVPLARSMRPASCSSAAPSATNTSVMEARCSAKLLSLFTGRVGSYIPGCGRRWVAISRMPSSTDLARPAAPEIFLAISNAQHARSTIEERPTGHIPSQQQRPLGGGILREAQADRLGEKFAFLLPLGFIQAPSDDRVFSPTFSSDGFQFVFWRMRFNSCVNSPNGGGRQTGPIIVCCQPALVEDLFARTVCGDPTVDVS